MKKRLIEAAFPLREAALDSVHEKNVRHGHISTLHVWPARRPLAASRAALLATLLPDPGTEVGRRALTKRIGGRIVQKSNSKGQMRDATEGGVLHWERVGSPELFRSRSEIRKLRDEIREAFGGRAPRVLDPFAGGGAIPLEAMRLGCDVTASDINPVAWFILRCTLHYPRLVGGGKQPLPGFVRDDPEFLGKLRKAKGKGRRPGALFGSDDGPIQADFAWHLRAWGRHVLSRARQQLATRYPVYAEFEPVHRKGSRGPAPLPRVFEPRPPQLLQPDSRGRVSVKPLNAEFDRHYLDDPANPRWVQKPTVAYLWARTAECGDCRAEVPLLKTRWLCKKAGKRVRLTMEARRDRTGVEFGVQTEVPLSQGSQAQQRVLDQELGAGTMNRSGATCPCCSGIATMKDLHAVGRACRMGERMTAVVVNGQRGKEYRLPTAAEVKAAHVLDSEIEAIFRKIPHGAISERLMREGPGASYGFPIVAYGLLEWCRMFTKRQLLSLGTLLVEIRLLSHGLDAYPQPWREALSAYLGLVLSKSADYSSAICSWHNGKEQLRNTFARFALPMVWDYCEVNPLGATSGSFTAMSEWVARYLDRTAPALLDLEAADIRAESAIALSAEGFDVICTDPPYYDAIPYSDLMDFFHVWLRRVLHGLSDETDAMFAESLGPKWDSERSDGELVDDAVRFDGDRDASKQNYEDGMARAFGRCREALNDDGRLVVVFASKSPDAWETLVSAVIRSGFVVTASWPVQTEMANRQRSLSGAALSSSIWIVCRKRPSTRPGWESQVLEDMERRITQRLRDFWDAGIRGPDFVWSATGPALEAFSRYPAVRRQDSPGQTLTVAEFLRRVRRMVVGFVIGQVMDSDEDRGDLDDRTTYYLLHRHDFGLGAAPAGAVILYALSCDLADSELTGRWNLLSKVKGSGGETAMKLKSWKGRRHRGLGEPDATGTAPPLMDCLHRLMQLWRAGERSRVDAYLEERGLWRNTLFARVVQAVLELADTNSEERSMLESLQTHLGGPRRSPMRRNSSPGRLL